MIISVTDQRIGDVTSVGKIIKFHDEIKDNSASTAPLLGQHNDEIYGEFLSREQIADLESENVI